MTEYVAVADLGKILGNTLSRRQLRRVVDHEEVLAMTKKVNRKRYVPASQFLDWYAAYVVRSAKRTREYRNAAETQAKVMAHIEAHPRVSISSVSRDLGLPKSCVRHAFDTLEREDRIKLVCQYERLWSAGSRGKCLSYPEVPAHCLGRTGGWWS